MWRYAGSLDVRCVRTRVCNPVAVEASEELHARSKGYLTLVMKGEKERGERERGKREGKEGKRENRGRTRGEKRGEREKIPTSEAPTTI